MKNLGAMKRIIIVDDNEMIREGAALVLNATDHYSVVGTYYSFETAETKFKSDNPDIVLMDLELPGISGVESISRIKAMNPNTDVLVVTVHDNVEMVFQALTVGAVGYITKSNNNFFLELTSALDEMSRGGSPMSTTIARMVVSSFQRSMKSPLSIRETQVLELFSAGKTYSAIAEDLFIAKTTVRAHIRNIYEKLQVNNKAEAIEKAFTERLI